MLTNDDILSLAESYGNWSMSDFQSRYFVVNSHVTDYRRVKQAVLEIEKRNDILIKLKIEEIAAEPNPLKQELLLIDLDQYQYDNSVYEKKLRICEEELDMFCNLIKELVPDKESLENYKGHNEEKEREYWILRMGKQAALDMLALGRIGQGNLDSISMMPIEDQQEVIRLGLSYTNSLNKAIGYMDEDVKLELTNTKKISTIDKLLASQHKTSSEQID